MECGGIILAPNQRRNQRIALLGGVTGDTAAPVIGLKSSMIVEDAVRRLVALGHRRIVLPLCDSPAPFADSLKQAMQTVLKDSGFPYVPAYHTPERKISGRDTLWRLLEETFSTRAPTALMTLGLREMIVVTCFLARRGLRVPEDVSLMLLNDQPEAEWFVPELSRYRWPFRQMAGRMVRWVEGAAELKDSVFVEADFADGGSIGPARS